MGPDKRRKFKCFHCQSNVQAFDKIYKEDPKEREREARFVSRATACDEV